MKLYQIEHSNCEPDEDNFTFRENTIYMNKENLVKDILNSGYELTANGEYIKIEEGADYYQTDLVSIIELDVVDNKVGAWWKYILYDNEF
ncbi:hypothetical protein KXP75_000951 [Staphylococcus pseudintermedius]|uniref:hypothetical protein n=1 Tax=Staphylococcus pseudintermedius TaxID=283734 RepID=UPI001A0FE8C6|nr:hypothetical protein [Staphylococcus pseudintermedius]EGQ2747462.1 hypothetical protein [Staphylococcus pseudintermedius]EHT8056365.1 hypothetical protein [Staphylococcus pseudintermedius]EIT0971759.1 hypothetical protein [Staphylococcus pseudintermedius]EJD8533402.1 hypothetical protein [Staphylococcus pseudintermedius]MDT0973758.1 hypothetical protein [Staphylococcus pseudintermedius]